MTKLALDRKLDGAQTLYVSRPLTNAADFIAWAKIVGFKKTLPENDFHVTIAFSKEPVDWNDVEPKTDSVDVTDGGRSIEKLGDKGAVVLRFDSPELTRRWHQFRGIGASWDWPEYRPHVTITYDGGDVDLGSILPYEGPLVFGPEEFAEVDPDAAEKAKARLKLAGDSALRLALDRDSVRSFDKDGRLRVAKTPISKANVCPYKGSEIPGYDLLGLDPEKIYNLLRDPDELAKAAPSLNGVPLLQKHVPVSADDHQPHEVVGSLGTDADFDGEYLNNSLFVNARSAIDGIETKKKRELSAGYHYRPDMTPGNFRGSPYDGVMRDIHFNHVALVEDGRAGPDVVVGDSTENLPMKTSRLAAVSLAAVGAYLSPRLAMDVALPKSLFTDIKAKTFKTQTPAIAAAVKKAADGKLRKGFAFDEGALTKLLNALEDPHGDESTSEEQHNAMAAAAKGESELGIPKEVGEEFLDKDKGKTFDAEAVTNFLREKGMSEDDITHVSGMFPKPALDEDADEAKRKAEEEAEQARKKAEDEAKEKNMVTKPAMDAAIKAAVESTKTAVVDQMRGVQKALTDVKPWVGEISGHAFDTAEQVHRHVAKAMKIAGAEKLHPDALLPVIQAQPKPGDRTRLAHDSTVIAQDAVEGFSKRFPQADRITVGG